MDLTIHHKHSFETTADTKILHALHQLGVTIMSAIDDLRAAVEASNTATAADLDALNVAMTAEFQRVTDALAAIPSQDPAIAAVTAQVQTMQASIHTGLSSAIDALNAEVPNVPPTP